MENEKKAWQTTELQEMAVVVLSLHQKWWQKFVCPEVLEIKNFEEAEKKSRVPAHDIHNYAAGSRNKVYGWEITAVKEYPQAVALEELGMKRAPQSWQYVR